VAGWSAEEAALVAGLAPPPASQVTALRRAIRAGEDPLGHSFSRLRSPAERRGSGATYTPLAIVGAMVDWACGAGAPARVVDPGSGSGRFLLAAGRAFRRARLLGVEIDPLAALMARGNLAASGLAGRAEIRLCDYRQLELAAVAGSTLFLGNPPYLRHHHIAGGWKEWLSRTARARGLAQSALAGLHVHFLLATLCHARPGDRGCLVTAAEWLDVNYGRLARQLLIGPLGLLRLDLVEPSARPFDDALATAVITGFEVGARSRLIEVRRVGALAPGDRLAGGRRVARARLAREPRWTALTRAGPPRRSHELVELGELCRVHRGQVTGANRVWIAGSDTPRLPARFLVPAVTSARELFAAGTELTLVAPLRRIIALPAAIDALPEPERAEVEAFLAWARRQGADRSYVARHRSPWWSVKLRAPAPLLATYMARRPPAFVRNRAGARHINIAHGIYPREPLADACLDLLAAHLIESVSLADGRAYAGGLVKFEPGEMERLLVPGLDLLRSGAAPAPRATPVKSAGRTPP
jgi:hypothetical protein